MRRIGTFILATFMTLFGLVFVLAGSAVVLLGITGGEGPDSAPWFVFVPFGLVFVGAGSFVIWKAFRLPGEQERAEKESEQYASEPWKQVSEWQSNRISENSRGSVWFLWIFAILWNTITASVIGLSWEQMLLDAQEEPAIYAILLFPLVGIGVLSAAIYMTLRARKFPASAITLSTMPVPCGGALEGTLEIPDLLRAAETIRVRLTCYRITRSGKDTHSTPVWQDELELPAVSMTSDGRHGLLPIRMRLPSDAPETTIGYGSRISWQLDLSADVPGVDYYASFPIPVFGGAATEEHDENIFTMSAPLAPRSREQNSAPIRRTVLMDMSPDGGMQWNFRPARVIGPGLGIFAFATVWGTITWFLLTVEDVPGLIGGVFGFFFLLLVWGLYDMWLTRIVITIRDGTLTRRSGPLIPVRYIQLTRDEIRDFTLRAGMSAGSTAYYDISLVRANGRKLRVGSYLRSVREAEEIISEMKGALGMQE